MQKRRPRTGKPLKRLLKYAAILERHIGDLDPRPQVGFVERALLALLVLDLGVEVLLGVAGGR